MPVYATYHAAIIGLHEKGFREDFVLFGNDLMWVQEKILLQEQDFSICECHRFAHPLGKDDDLVIFGIDVSQAIKGILMNHYTFTSGIPPVMISKLKQSCFYQ